MVLALSCLRHLPAANERKGVVMTDNTKLSPWHEVTSVRPGSSGHERSRRAASDTQARLGYGQQLAHDWQSRAVTALGEAVQGNRALSMWMDTCVKCGACTDKCHFYRGTGDPKNMPVARQDLLRSVYRRYHTRLGRWFPWLVGARDLDEDMLQDWETYFHQCTQCRRCAVYCPVGIDTAEFSMVGRAILNEIGVGQHFTNDILDKAGRLGNNLGLPGPALEDTLAGLEEELEEQTGKRVRLPLDDTNAQMLVVVPSADFFAEPHVDGLLGIAKVLHQAGVSWTLSSQACEAANFALFVGDVGKMGELASVIRSAALELGTRQLVIGECGHAWRVAHAYMPNLLGGFDFLGPEHPRPEHIIEVTHGLISAGALRLDASRNDERTVTYHDSCNIARGSSLGERAGGQLRVPREVLRAVCNHFVEMPRDTIGQASYCCGAGAGLLADDLLSLRVRGAQPRMLAYREVAEREAVTHIAAMCAICKSQLTRVFPEYGYERESVISVHQLVGDALVF
jgi:Fe-S oxidoreductase